MTTAPKVSIVHLARTNGMGALKRVAGLRAIFESVGAEVDEVLLRRDHRASVRDAAVQLPAVLRGRAVPETLAWSARDVQCELAARGPDVVICETSRAFHPLLTDGPWVVVLDYVDRLSVSYGDRSGIVAGLPRRQMFRALARTSARFEDRSARPGIEAIAAGWSDARALGARWVPITVDLPPVATGEPRYDVVFFGNLVYPPNLEAIHRLGRIWPAVVERRPGTTLLLAGANPTPVVRRMVDTHGWHLAENYPDLGELLRTARMGIIPLLHASGIQLKLLEGAAHGLAQLVDPIALAGTEPGFPAAVGADDDELVAELHALLDDHDRRAALGQAARQHIVERYSTEAWRTWAGDVLARARR